MARLALVAVLSAGAAVFYASYSELGDRGPYPELWRQRAFWAGWLTMLDRVVPLPWALASIAGTIVAAPPARSLLLGLWGGYLLLGFSFSHHIYTHDYYSLPAIPIAALSVAALVDACLRRLPASSLRWSAAGVQAACVLGLCWGVFQAGVFEPAPPELQARVQLYERIGAAVDHSTKVASLDGDYGYSLSYHGLLSAGNLPLGIDVAMARLNGVTLPPADQRLAGTYADFFVATSQQELDAQPDLLAALDRGYPVVFRDGFRSRWRAVVYDLRRPPSAERLRPSDSPDTLVSRAASRLRSSSYARGRLPARSVAASAKASADAPSALGAKAGAWLTRCRSFAVPSAASRLVAGLQLCDRGFQIVDVGLPRVEVGVQLRDQCRQIADVRLRRVRRHAEQRPPPARPRAARP